MALCEHLGCKRFGLNTSYWVILCSNYTKELYRAALLICRALYGASKMSRLVQGLGVGFQAACRAHRPY